MMANPPPPPRRWRRRRRLLLRLCLCLRLRLLLFLHLFSASAAAPIRLPDFSSCSLISDQSPAGATVTLTYNCCLAHTPPSAAAIPSLSPLDAGGGPLRMRLPAHRLTESFKQKYERAYSLMRALPEDDPRSFSAQARLHCAFCGGAYAQTAGGPPLEIHYSWLFLPWHRLFLYFHERILAELVQDPAFALPFWNWDDQRYGGNELPEVFFEKRGSALYDEARRNSPGEVVKLEALSKTSEAAALVAENLAVMSRAMLSGAATAELFEGGAARLGSDLTNSTVLNAPLGGSLENGPHNAVHFWSGSPSLPLAQDMGSFPTGARDPLFYAHHSNVDRLWELWRRRHSDHSDADFLDAEFLFYDEYARAVKVKASDALDLRRLRIGYESVEAADRLWIEYAAPHLGPTSGGRPCAPPPENYTDLASGTKAPPLVLESKLTVRLRLPEPLSEEESGGDGRMLLLVLEGVRLRRDRYVQILAFVNWPEADERTSSAAAECVGSYGAMPAALAGRRRRTEAAELVTNVKFRFGAASLLSADEGDKVFVTLVLRRQPEELPEEGGERRKPPPYNVTIGGAKIIASL